MLINVKSYAGVTHRLNYFLIANSLLGKQAMRHIVLSAQVDRLLYQSKYAYLYTAKNI